MFFSAFTFAIWMTDGRNMGGLPEKPMQIGSLIFLLGGIFLFYKTLLQLKRVEMDADFVYVTNYHKHARYPYHNIEKIEELDYLVFNLVRIHLREPGYFGKRISFIPSKKRFQDFLNEHPEVVGDLITKATSES